MEYSLRHIKDVNEVITDFVLILILMEYSLRLSLQNFIANFMCLNPYSNGI